MLYNFSMDTKVIQMQIPSNLIDLGTGIPGLELLPMPMIERAAERYFAAGDRRTLQYGREQGSGYFLDILADFLTSSHDFHVRPENLLATNGVSGALDLLCTLFTNPGDVILVEEPTYFLALRIFADHHLQVEAVPLDQEGLDLDALEIILSQIHPRFLYTIPAQHNPANVTLSAERRKRLVDLAREHDITILADEVYQFLNYTKEPPRPLAAFVDQTEQVISLNSFSKILAPGLRLGWIQAARGVIERISGCGLLDSGGGLNPFTSSVIQYLIASGELEANIADIKEVFQERLRVMDRGLRKHLPQASYSQPEGGYYFWVRLPGTDTQRLRKRAQKAGVDFRPGVLFSSRGVLRDYLRLSFSYYRVEELETGVRKLAEIWKS